MRTRCSRDTVTGTPQGGILSPLLANVALSVLDEHFMRRWEAAGTAHKRRQRRLKGLANYRIVRYADDFVVLVSGTQEHTEALRDEVAALLAPMGLRLSEEKTVVTHIDEGFDFLGFRIQRKRQEGNQPAHHLHLPVEDRPGGDQGEGAGADTGQHRSNPRQPLAAGQPGAERLGQLLPPRRVGEDLRLSQRLELAASGQLASPQTPQSGMELAPAALPARVAADGRQGHAVQPGHDPDHQVSLPGNTYPHAVDEVRRHRRRIAERHELVESRMRGVS